MNENYLDSQTMNDCDWCCYSFLFFFHHNLLFKYVLCIDFVAFYCSIWLMWFSMLLDISFYSLPPPPKHQTCTYRRSYFFKLMIKSTEIGKVNSSYQTCRFSLFLAWSSIPYRTSSHTLNTTQNEKAEKRNNAVVVVVDFIEF